MPKTINDVKLYQEATFKQLDIVTDTENPSVLFIEGYATVVSNPDGSKYIDRDGEHVAIDLLKTSDYLLNPVIVFNHDWGDVVGKCLELTKNEKGLYIKAEIHRLTGREQVFEAVQKGLIKTFSIGFLPESFTYLEAEDAFEISSAELIEISLAPVPANGKAIFGVTGSKSLQVNKNLVQKQTHMSCDELSGICTINKQLKGKDMADKIEVKTGAENTEPKKEVVENKEQEPKQEPKQEVKDEPKKVVETEPAKEPKAEAEEPKKDKPLSVEDLASEIVKANQLAEQAKAEEEKRIADEAAAQAEAEKEAEKKRIQDALDYIKTRKEEIERTPASELDVDELDEYYELLSDTVEAINSKVLEAVGNVA